MTKAGQKANNWFTRSLYDTLSGEDWVLFADHEDPRKRQWVKYDRNGKVVNKKTGALNLGGNTTEYIKRGGPVKTALGIPRQSEKDFVKDQGGRLDEYKDQPKPEKPKKKKPAPLEHLDDARDERDNKWAEGLEGIGDALSGSDEAESTLESIATIVDAAATIKKANDNRKKSGEPTETKSGDNVAEKDHEFYSKITGNFYNFDETDAGLKRNYYLEQLDPKDPKQRVMQHNGAVNLTNADIGQENTSYQIMLKKEAAKAEARNKWLQETSNSPAAKAFEPDDPRKKSWDTMRYEQHLKHTGVDSVDTPEAKIEENKLEKENTVIEDNKKAELPDKTIADDTTSIFERNKDKFKIGGRSLFGNVG